MKKWMMVWAALAAAGVQAKTASFADFDRRAKAGEVLNVVYFGASLTYSANASDPSTTGFRGLMSDYLVKRYPEAHFRFFDAAIGGTPSTLGLFRMERDVLSKNPDLVFLDFVCNDGYENTGALRTCAYEQILRTLIAKGVAVEQVFFTFKWLAGTDDQYEQRMPRQRVYRNLAEAYGTPWGNASEVIRQALLAKKTSLDGIWPIDGGHPADYGYGLFFESARLAFEKGVADGAVCRVPADPVYGSVENVRRLALCEAVQPLPKGWTRELTFRMAMWFDGLSSRWMGDVARGASGAEPLEVKATGNVVAFFGEADGHTALPIELALDGGAAKTCGFSHGCDGRLMVYAEQPDADWRKGAAAERTITVKPRADEKKPNGEVRIESVMTGVFKPTAAGLAVEAAGENAKKAARAIPLDEIDHARGKKQ